MSSAGDGRPAGRASQASGWEEPARRPPRADRTTVDYGRSAVNVPGEFELIERLRIRVPPERRAASRQPGVVVGIGDDAAVVRPLARREIPAAAEQAGAFAAMLATCDVQVENVHFTRALCTPADVGWRALAVNLSDIAAMGGTPRYALVSLLIPESVGTAALEEMYEGLAELAGMHGVAVIGGNVSSTAGPLAVDVTLLGDVEHPVLRAGARPGDGIWLTGHAGKAAAGRFVLEHGDEPAVTSTTAPADREVLAAAYRRPVPRVTAGRLLGDLARAGVVTAMIDTSDGAASDLLHLAEASQAGARLDAASLPVLPGLPEAAAAAGVAVETWTLGGGEDYELLFTASESFAQRAPDLAAAAGVPITRIGEVLRPEQGRWVVAGTGERRPLRPAGWDHLARRL